MSRICIVVITYNLIALGRSVKTHIQYACDLKGRFKLFKRKQNVLMCSFPVAILPMHFIFLYALY